MRLPSPRGQGTAFVLRPDRARRPTPLAIVVVGATVAAGRASRDPVAGPRSDAAVIDAALEPRPRLMVAAVAAAPPIGLAILLTLRVGTVGQCLGIVGGRLTQSVASPHPMHAYVGTASGPAGRARVRPFVAMSLLCAAGAARGDSILAPHGLGWASAVAATFPALLGLAPVPGLPALAPAAVLRRGRELARRLG